MNPYYGTSSVKQTKYSYIVAHHHAFGLWPAYYLDL